MIREQVTCIDRLNNVREIRNKQPISLRNHAWRPPAHSYPSLFHVSVAHSGYRYVPTSAQGTRTSELNMLRR